MTTGYDSLSTLKNELIRKGLKGSVFIAPASAAVIDETTLFDSSSGELSVLPAGYTDLGWLTDAGVKASRAIKDSDIMGWGSTVPLRTDITGDTTTLVLEAQETKLETIGLYVGVDPTTIVPGTNGVVKIIQPSVSAAITYRTLVVSVDESNDGEIVIARFLPRASVTNFTDQVFANGDAPTTWGVTLTAYEDSAVGYSQAYLFGGAGWKALYSDLDIPRVVTCTVALTTALVATTGTFAATDVGAKLSGSGIAAGAKISAFTDTTHVTMSAAGTVAATGVAVTVS